MNKNKLLFNFVLILILLSAPVSSYSLSITGTVIDFSDETLLVNDAQVIIINTLANLIDTVYTNADGNWDYSIPATSVKGNYEEIPSNFEVSQNYPNPFNPSTVIEFSIQNADEVTVLVHNMLGQKVDERKQYLLPGNYKVDWYSKGSSGIYFYTISMGGKSFTKKMIQLDGGYYGGLSEIRTINRISENFALKNNISTHISLIISKFGYIPDTLSANVSDGNHFETLIETIHSHAVVIDLHNDML